MPLPSHPVAGVRSVVGSNQSAGQSAAAAAAAAAASEVVASAWPESVGATLPDTRAASADVSVLNLR
eukprot:351440-Chlamydomonas_euryale.AAC.5